MLERWTAHHTYMIQADNSCKQDNHQYFNRSVLQHPMAAKVNNQMVIDAFLKNHMVQLDKPSNAKPPPQPEKVLVETPSTSNKKLEAQKQTDTLKSSVTSADNGTEPTPVKKRQRKKAVRKSDASDRRGRKKSFSAVEVSQLAPKPRGQKPKGRPAKGRPRKRATPCYVVDARKDNERQTKGRELTFRVGNSSYAIRKHVEDVDVNGEYTPPEEPTHHWRVYFRDHPDAEESMLSIVKSVQFFLHDSYEDNAPVVKRPAFCVENKGWYLYVTIMNFVLNVFRKILLKYF